MSLRSESKGTSPRRGKAWSSPALSSPARAAASSAAPAEDGDLLRAVQALPEKYSAVIHLHYYEGYSIKEIAKLLGLPAATVGTRLARGRERLRQMLKEDVV